jgi:hypothetical protein
MAFHARTFWVDPSKPKEENIKRNKKQMGSRARTQDQDIASVVVTSFISSRSAPMRIEKLMVEDLFPSTRAKIQRLPTRNLKSRIRGTRGHQGL